MRTNTRICPYQTPCSNFDTSSFAYFRMRGGALFAPLRSLRLNLMSFVKLILNLTAKSVGTFQKIPATLPNFQISRRSKSRGFFGRKIAVFAKRCYTTTYNLTGLPPLGEGGVGPSRRGPAGLQRGPYGILAAAPLQHDGVLVAMPRGPYCSTKPAFCPFPAIKNS